MATRPKIVDFQKSERELGSSGTPLSGRTVYPIQDYNADLQGLRGMDVFEKMRRSDGEVAASLARIMMPIKSANWRIEPGHSQKDYSGRPKASDKDIQISEWIDRNLILRADSLNRGETWQSFLDHALLMLVFGFSLFEKVWAQNADGDWVYRKIAPRLARTIFEVRMDDDRQIQSVMQRAYQPNKGFVTAEIPGDKIAIYTFGREGDNWYGTSILRPAYMHWSMKQELLWVDAASLERFGMGVLELHATDNVTADEKAEAEKVASEFRSHERQWLFTPANFSANFHYPPSGTSRAIDSVKYHDSQIARTMMAEFMSLGASESGSRSVAQSKIDLMMLSLQGLVRILEQGTDMQIIKPLVDRKFGAQPDYPKLRCEDLDKMTGDQVAALLQPLVSAGVVRIDQPLREFMRDSLNLPPEDPSTVEQPPQAALSAFAGGQNPEQGQNGQNSGNGKAPPPTGKQPEGKNVPPTGRDQQVKGEPPTRKLFEVAIGDGPRVFQRAPFRHEAHMDFHDIAGFLDKAPTQIWHRSVAPVRREQIAKLAKSVANATDSELANGKLRVPKNDVLVDGLLGGFKNAYTRGRADVAKELASQRQNHTRRFAEGDPDVTSADVSSADYTSADTPESELVDEPNAPTQGELAWLKRLAEAAAAGMGVALLARAIQQGMVSRQAEQSPNDTEFAVRQSLTDLSEPKAQSDLAGQLHRAYATGRSDEAKARTDEIGQYVYSAMMDEGTDQCAAEGGVCSSLDGQDHEPGDPQFETPSPYCAWPPNCRCVTIYVAKDTSGTGQEELAAREPMIMDGPSDEARGPDGKWIAGGGIVNPSDKGSGGNARQLFLKIKQHLTPDQTEYLKGVSKWSEKKLRDSYSRRAEAL